MTAHDSASKKKGARPYTLKRRAQRQAETRQRIVEAAVDLHGTVGPARTTLSMVAERAGVQRHTLYAHFPDERSLLMACSGHFMTYNPPPDAEAWRGIDTPRERLGAGLRAVYAWYARNAPMTACVLRDSEVHSLVNEVNTLWMAPVRRRYAEVLGAGLSEKQGALLGLALSFHTWRTLVQECGMAPDAAAETMVEAIASA